jgi:hypothetical protein
MPEHVVRARYLSSTVSNVLALGILGSAFTLAGCSSSPTPNDGGATTGTSSGSSSGGSGSGSSSGSSGGPASCAPNVTITGLAFYGSGTASSASVCSGITPPTATIMNAPYTDTGMNVFTYGSAPYVWSTYTAESPAQTALTTNIATSTGAVTFAGQITPMPDGGVPYLVAGFAFDSATTCVNASSYAGIMFNLSGDLGGCNLFFEVDSSEDGSPVYSPNTGTCTAAECANSSYAITKIGTVNVPFSNFAGGMPQSAADPTSILSFQLVFTLP